MAFDIKGVCPYFEVYDMPTSLRFYIDQLGFTIVEHSPHLGGDPYRYHWVCCGSAKRSHAERRVRIRRRASAPRRTHAAARPREACLFFGCPDVDGAYAELLARGVKIDREPKVAPYGMKQMYFNDPDGFGLCFQWRASDARNSSQ